MNSTQKIALLTLLGLILPLGNVWGPFLLSGPMSSDTIRFKKKMVLIEIIVSLISWVIPVVSIVQKVKTVASDLSFGDYISQALTSTLWIQPISILGIALIAYFYEEAKSMQESD